MKHKDKNNFGIIIPYFQKMPGLLTRAVRSVLDQTCRDRVFIVVVDDGSPHPARTELDAFTEEERASILLIEQVNAGVSAARNRGIDAMPDEVGYLAFLDPDDTWHPQHLENASIAFESGAEFYFADFQRCGSDKTRFERSNLDLSLHTKCPSGWELYRFCGEFRSDMIRTTMVGTSTVVMSQKLCGANRFNVDLTASEDILMWFLAVKSTSIVYFSARCEAMYGVCVGLITNSTWGSMRSMRVALDQAKMLAIIIKEPDNDIVTWIKKEQINIQNNCCRTIIHRLVRRKKIDIGAIFKFVILKPMIVFRFFRCSWCIINDRG
ncbi:glycosyltransferase family A protein [Acidiphilium acidophilum]|uniref:glycosyltransferase family A protein n=1 Tax=Acidiphilium acidophilum TaxID=76588 RepID=UPI002E8E689F|nr:glycosyltransferase family A protein [Acidiphilium acidophilum]